MRRVPMKAPPAPREQVELPSSPEFFAVPLCAAWVPEGGPAMAVSKDGTKYKCEPGEVVVYRPDGQIVDVVSGDGDGKYCFAPVPSAACEEEED